MLRSSKELIGYVLHATDGSIGRVKDFYFDDEAWIIRYLIADTGTWLPGRKVLIIPDAVGKPEWVSHIFPVNLTKEQIKNSPSIDEEKPVSRQNEIELYEFYGWAPYWYTPGTAGQPGIPTPLPRPLVKREKFDPHLRSIKEVKGYHIHAIDNGIGHIDDFIVDDERWAIRYLVVDTRNWLPGKKVLIAPDWIERVNWEERKVNVTHDRETIKNSPEYDPTKSVNRECECRLYDYYGRPRYWENI